MANLNIFDFVTTHRSMHSVERAVGFMHDLDQFAENFDVGRAGPGLLDSLLQRLLDGEANGELMFDVLRAEVARTLVNGYSMTKEDGYKLLMAIILTALHFAVEALQAKSDAEAYDHLSDARYLRGYADGIIYSGNDALIRADLARVGGKARQAENKEIKKCILEWYAENHGKFKSLDAAAEAARKQGPVAFTTARKWISEYKKANKLQ
jgi:hypothetical protein